jgi:hypothetical protein
LPDQLEFSKDCRTIVVSNEGEPETYTPASLANDPEGSVSIIDLVACEGLPGLANLPGTVGTTPRVIATQGAGETTRWVLN